MLIVSLACVYTAMSSNHLTLSQLRLCDDVLEPVKGEIEMTASDVVYL